MERIERWFLLLVGLTVGRGEVRAQAVASSRAVVYRVPTADEVSRFEVPQVRLADEAVARRINRSILRCVFGKENIDTAASAAQVLKQAAKVCCWDADAHRWKSEQGLTSSGYEVLLNEHGLLSLELIQEFTGAYSYESTGHLNFDLRTGLMLTLVDVIADPPVQLQRRMHGAITRRLEEALGEMMKEQLDTADIALVVELYSWDKAGKRIRFKSDPGPADEARASEPDFGNFALTPTELRLYYGPVLPHVIQNMDLDGTYHFPYTRIQPRGVLVPIAKASPTATPKW